MKKKNSLLLILILVQIVAFGQVKLSKDFNVTVGTPYEVVDAKSKDYFSDGKSNAITVKTDGEKVTIQRYDFVSMKEVSRKSYEDFPPYNKIQKVMQLGDKLFYIFSSFNKKEKKEDIYLREINMSDGTFQAPKLLFSTGSEATVSSYGDVAGMTMFGLGVPIRFEVHKSFDNSKLLIRYRLKPEEKKDSKNFDVLGFYVFDAALQKQWGGEVKMPYTEKEMNNLAYAVSKNGKAFMLAYINESKRFELITIGNDLKVTTNKIDINGDLYFQQFMLTEAADGNLTAIGYYANGIDVKVNWTANATLSYNINGILNFKMDQNGKVLEKFDFEFPLELINQYESLRAKEKNEKREGEGKAGINDLKVIAVALDPDGSTTIIGEQQYQRKEFVYTRQAVVYYYGDIIATKFDKKGKLLWMKKLPKTQTGEQGKGGMSVRYIKGKGASYVLYLDNIKNASLHIADVPAKHNDGQGGYLTAYKIDDVTGAIERHSIFNIEDIKGIEAFQFRTHRIFDAKDKVFLVEFYMKGKKDTMAKMELAY
jgi:hypothetical protein